MLVLSCFNTYIVLSCFTENVYIFLGILGLDYICMITRIYLFRKKNMSGLRVHIDGLDRLLRQHPSILPLGRDCNRNNHDHG